MDYSRIKLFGLAGASKQSAHSRLSLWSRGSGTHQRLPERSNLGARGADGGACRARNWFWGGLSGPKGLPRDARRGDRLCPALEPSNRDSGVPLAPTPFVLNTRDETRTRITLACWGILSPLRLPIPPPGQVLLLQQLTAKYRTKTRHFPITTVKLVKCSYSELR